MPQDPLYSCMTVGKKSPRRYEYNPVHAFCFSSSAFYQTPCNSPFFNKKKIRMSYSCWCRRDVLWYAVIQCVWTISTLSDILMNLVHMEWGNGQSFRTTQWLSCYRREHEFECHEKLNVSITEELQCFVSQCASIDHEMKQC